MPVFSLHGKEVTYQLQNLESYSACTQYYGQFCNILYQHSNGEDYCHINQALANKIRAGLPVDMKMAGKILKRTQGPKDRLFIMARRRRLNGHMFPEKFLLLCEKIQEQKHQ